MVVSEQVDLNLEIPDHLDLQSLFPDDRMLRLHPNWFVSEFNDTGESFTANIKDYVSDKKFELFGKILFHEDEQSCIKITLSGIVDIEIHFFPLNHTLHVQTRSNDEIEATDPVLLWIRAIKEYIRLYIRKTPVTLFFRLLMNKMVLQMNPSQRKICMMLAKITLVEIIVIIFILIGYVIFVL